jgi:hypothetical protein
MVRAALRKTGLLALITTGCVDFGLVAPGERVPFVQVIAEVTHDETLTVELEVLIVTEANAAGRPYEPTDPTIYVNGAAVHPVAPPANGAYSYRTTVNPPEPIDPNEFLQVSLPALAAAAGPPPALAIPFVGRRGDATLQLSPGEDLVLGIAVPAATGGLPARRGGSSSGRPAPPGRASPI